MQARPSPWRRESHNDWHRGAVFARYLNLAAGYVSQLKRGVKRPTGPTLVLLNIIQRKGIGAIL